LIGERVNNYQVLSLLGEGGMGAVYLAEHPFMGRKAAIKVLRRELAEDKGLVERFMNEARAANAIHHPNIIDIIDVGQLPSGVPYLMMEFLDGESLAKRIEREKHLAISAAVDIATQTASALYAAHGKGIVHRDLKPDNLYLVPDEGRQLGQRVTVLDFGIAKLRGELSGSGAKTQSGSVMGTPPYMSPEQCRGITDEIDHRTDVYALGIILYEMLTGTPPFMSEGWGEVVLMHVTKAPPPPRARNPEISPELEAVILKALAKVPADRWDSMADLGTALQKAIGASGRGFISGFTSGAPTATKMPSVGSGRAATTLQSATGQVSEENAEVDDVAAGAPRAWWRRPVAWVGGGVVAAAAVAAIGLGGHRVRPTPSSDIPSGASAAALAAAPAPQVERRSAAAPRIDPAPAPEAAAAKAPAAVPIPVASKEVAAPPADEVASAPAVHSKSHAHKHESAGVAAKKAAPAGQATVAVRSPASPPVAPPASPPPVTPVAPPLRSRPAAEKW
jgi:tRNA A-37 threonylcarbamoyl transferase component Bud32